MSEKRKRVLRVAYYVLNFTGGLPTVAVGVLLGMVLRICGFKPRRCGGGLCFEVGHGYGGFSIGLTFVVSRESGESVRRHEFGHSVQNAVLGPLMPIAVSLPSVMRYWYRELCARLGKAVTTPYDGIWFEASATALGEKYFRVFERG